MRIGKRGFWSLIVTVVVLVIAGVLTVVFTGGSGRKSAQTPPQVPVISVKGNLTEIADKRFILAGATFYALPFYVDSSGGPDSALAGTTQYEYDNRVPIFAEMKKIHVNTVRIAVGTAGYDTNAYGLTKAAYVQRARNLVASAKAAGLRVVFCWWDALSLGSQLPAQYQTSFPMMRDLYRGIGNDSSVTYEPFNEPNAVSWADWLKVSTGTLKYWRSLGYHGVLWMDTIGYSWEFDPTYATDLMTVDKNTQGSAQVVFANHRYARDNNCFCGTEKSTWITDVGQYVSRYPIAGTEYGWWNGAGTTPQPTWNRQLYDYITQVAVPNGFNGAGEFVWDWVDLNTMTQPGGLELNAHGSLVASSLFSRL